MTSDDIAKGEQEGEGGNIGRSGERRRRERWVRNRGRGGEGRMEGGNGRE